MNYWKFSPGKGARFWDYCRINKCAAIGWSQVGSLLDFETLEQLSVAFNGQNWGSRKWNTGDTQLWNLKKICGKNDVVASYGRGYILSVGIVNKKYYFDDKNKIDEEWDDMYSHRIWVEWIPKTKIKIKNNVKLYGKPRDFYGTLNKQLTFYEIVDEYTIDYLNKLIKTDERR